MRDVCRLQSTSTGSISFNSHVPKRQALLLPCFLGEGIRCLNFKLRRDCWASLGYNWAAFGLGPALLLPALAVSDGEPAASTGSSYIVKRERRGIGPHVGSAVSGG